MCKNIKYLAKYGRSFSLKTNRSFPIAEKDLPVVKKP